MQSDFIVGTVGVSQRLVVTARRIGSGSIRSAGDTLVSLGSVPPVPLGVRYGSPIAPSPLLDGEVEIARIVLRSSTMDVFAWVESGLYPGLAAWYEARAAAWRVMREAEDPGRTAG